MQLFISFKFFFLIFVFCFNYSFFLFSLPSYYFHSWGCQGSKFLRIPTVVVAKPGVSMRFSKKS